MPRCLERVCACIRAVVAATSAAVLSMWVRRAINQQEDQINGGDAIPMRGLIRLARDAGSRCARHRTRIG